METIFYPKSIIFVDNLKNKLKFLFTALLEIKFKLDERRKSKYCKRRMPVVSSTCQFGNDQFTNFEVDSPASNVIARWFIDCRLYFVMLPNLNHPWLLSIEYQPLVKYFYQKFKEPLSLNV